VLDIEIRVLDSLAVCRDGAVLSLPRSRQTRALLAYLVLSQGPRRRDHLASLLWEGASDPRAGLRWSLAKLKPLLAGARGNALVADRDTVALDRGLFNLDLTAVEAVVDDDAAELVELDAAERRFGDEVLPNLDVDGATEFRLWLESERQRIGALHRRLLLRLATHPSNVAEAALHAARKAVALDPYDPAANRALLSLTHTHAGRNKAQAVLDESRRRWEEAGIDVRQLFDAWQAMVRPGAAAAPAPTPLVDQAANAPALGPPSIAVLGFAGIGDEGDILAEGLASDLSSRLAQVRGLFVVARASAARFSTTQYPISEIGRRLGVRYLLHGRTQRHDRRLRVTVDLVETERGAQVWSEHFDRSIDELFAVQDDITNAVIAAVLPEIERAEMERARLQPPESLDAWACFHRALWHSFRFRARDTEIAFEFLNRALAHDPGFARAYAGRSFAHFSRAFLGTVPDVDAEVGRALEAAQQSVDLDGRDAMGHWALGRAQFLAREHDRALAALERCIEVNPNYAQGHYARGFVGTHAGLPELALTELDVAHRLSPFDPLLFAIKSTRGIALATQGRFDEAATWAVRATQEPNAHFHIHAVAAACLALAGRQSDAQRAIETLRAQQPEYSIARFERSFPNKLDTHRDLLRSALAKAGLPQRADGA